MIQETPIEKRRAFIAKTVDFYIKNYPNEYAQSIQKVQTLRHTKDTKFAEVHNSDVLDRHLFELPERLYLALQAAVGGDILQDKNERRWFEKKYPQFKISA